MSKKLYDFVIKATKFLVKHRAVYYILQFTWGLPLTLIGIFVSLIVKLLGGKTRKYLWVIKHEFKESWGGSSIGATFIRDTNSSHHVDKHEFGHTFQNCVFGPFMIFLVSIPSAVRYWIYTIGKKDPLTYDKVWFEKAATDCGTYAEKEILKNITKPVDK